MHARILGAVFVAVFCCRSYPAATFPDARLALSASDVAKAKRRAPPFGCKRKPRSNQRNEVK